MALAKKKNAREEVFDLIGRLSKSVTSTVNPVAKQASTSLSDFRNNIIKTSLNTQNYFNPNNTYSSSGQQQNNFWNSGTARTLGNIQQSLPTPYKKFSEGFGDATTFGLYKVPQQQSVGNAIGDTFAYGAGFLGGAVNPLNPVNKLGLFAKVGNVGSNIVSQGVSKLAPNLISKTAPKATQFIGSKVLPALGSELAQTVAYGGAKTALGQQFNPLQDYALGVGFRGLGKSVENMIPGLKQNKTIQDLLKRGQALGIDGINPKLFDLHPDDINELSEIGLKIRGKKPLSFEENATLERTFKTFLPGVEINNLTNKKAGDYVAWFLDVNNQIPKAMRQPFPGSSIVDSKQSSSREKLTGLLNYSEDLSKRGFKKEQIEKISYADYQKNFKNPGFENEVQRIQRSLEGSTQTPVGKKVNLLDYFRTPDRVLEKIGLGNESKLLRRQWDSYELDLPKQINKISEWSKQVTPESNQRIFQFLDGKPVVLNPQEQKVAGEIKDYLKTWADKLGLPDDKRVTNYITHLFDDDFIKKEFDEDLAKLISGQVPGSVYDPFVQQRLGKQGYKEDVWQALDAYTKRATRKYHLDPALKALKDKSVDLEKSQLDYLTKYAENLNLRPTELDNLVDNTVKSFAGYRFGQRPVANLSRQARQVVYRGTLGLNPGTAIRNLTQGANTYAKLGEKYTVKGYIDSFKNWNSGELQKVGVLTDSAIQDRQITATKKLFEKLDKGLYVFFDTAEKINRGAAYFGAKAQALDKGLNEQQAIEFAKKVVRDTQFTFGNIDTPVAMQSDLTKLFTQFQSFNVKQTEFLTEMLKKKEYAGIARWLGSTLVMGYALKEGLGISVDALPFQSILSGESKLGETPLIKAGMSVGQYAFGDEDKKQEALRDLGRTSRAFIPGGVQLGKTAEALKAMQEGGSFTNSGNLRFEVEPDVRTALFGVYSTKAGQKYLEDRLNNNLSAEEKAAQTFNQKMNGVEAEDTKQALTIVRELSRLKNGDERVKYFEQQVEEGKITEKVFKEMQNVFEQREKTKETGIVKATRSIRSNEQKAIFIADYLKKQSPENRVKMFEELSESTVMTEDLFKKIILAWQEMNAKTAVTVP